MGRIYTQYLASFLGGLSPLLLFPPLLLPLLLLPLGARAASHLLGFSLLRLLPEVAVCVRLVNCLGACGVSVSVWRRLGLAPRVCLWRCAAGLGAG